MSSKLPTIASCPRCGAIVLRAAGSLVHPTSAECDTVRHALGSYWFHHAHTRFDGRFHRCPERVPLNPPAKGGHAADTAQPGSSGTRRRSRPSWIIFQVATVAFLAASSAPARGQAEAKPGETAVAIAAGIPGADPARSRLGPDSRPGGRSTVTWQGQDLSEGRYQVTETLGIGASGVALRARDRNLDTDVVVEVPHPPPMGAAGFPARFVQGIRALALLSHPHLVKVTEVGTRDGSPFAISEYLCGGSLKYRTTIDPDGRPSPMPPKSLEEWLPDVAGALDFLHAQGHLHRDLRPANILFDAQGRVYLGGLGMAGAIEAAIEAETGATRVPSGLTLGAPGYMAPEQVTGQTTDGRADEYALAVIVYEWLCGRRPFEGHTTMAVLVQQLTREPPALHRVCPALPEAISTAVGRGLARDPRRRYPDCASFARAVVDASRASMLTTAASAPKGSHALVPPPTNRVTAGRSKVRPEGRWPLIGSAVGALAIVAVVLMLRAKGRRIGRPKVVEVGPIADSLRVLAASDLKLLPSGVMSRIHQFPAPSPSLDLVLSDFGGSPLLAVRPRRILWVARIGARASIRRRLPETSVSRVALAAPTVAKASRRAPGVLGLGVESTCLASRERSDTTDMPRRLAG